MLIFPIKLDNRKKLKEYMELFEKFACSGYVVSDGKKTPADDFLIVFSTYITNNLYLVLEHYLPNERHSIEDYVLEHF